METKSASSIAYKWASTSAMFGFITGMSSAIRTYVRSHSMNILACFGIGLAIALIFGFAVYIIVFIVVKIKQSITDNRVNDSVKIEKTKEDKLIDNQTKICPYCAEIIKFEAIKCRYCGERVDQKEFNIKTVQPELSHQLHQSKNTDNIEKNLELTLSQRQFSEDLKRLERKALARINRIYGNKDE